MQASGLTEFIPFICTSATWGQSCFLDHLKEWHICYLHSPSSSAITMGVAASTGSQFWEPSFTFEGQRSLMALTFFVYWYGRRYFHFTVWCLSFFNCCCSVARLCLTLWPHGLQHARLPCPSLSPGACSNSCPLSQWCHPTISSSVIHLSSCFQFLLASGPFLMSRLFKIN